MNAIQKPIIIQFPLRGEWYAPTTPAIKIPSHGTNRMGLRYAFDFLQVDWHNKKMPFQKVSLFRWFFRGVPLNKCYAWGQPIYAPCDGEIVSITDGIPERKVAHWLIDSAIAIKNATTFDERKKHFSQIAGNYLIMKCAENVYIAFAHLQTHSICVSLHEKVKQGMKIGHVGHSGNSTSPHLHFQLMDSPDLINAHGLPCVFQEYEVYKNEAWQTVYHQIPSDKDQFRFVTE